MHAYMIEGFNFYANSVRQRTHFSASSSSHESGCRSTFGSSRPQRHPARTCCQNNSQPAANGHKRIRQKFEKYPDGPTRIDTPVDAYNRRDVVAGRVYESLSLDSEDDLRGLALHAGNLSQVSTGTFIAGLGVTTLFVQAPKLACKG